MSGLGRSLYAFAALIALQVGANAQVSDNAIRIGVLTDLSGPFAETNGKGDVVAVQMAVDEFGAKVLDRPIEIISADHQNKPDVASAIARKWFDLEGIDVIVDVPNSAVALAVNEIARAKGKVVLATGPATSELTGKACSPTTVHWTYDTWMLANSTGKAVTVSGGDSWFFVTADYAFGHALERDTTKVVTANGGKVLGSVRAPLNVSDFASFLLQAQSSKAKVIGLANAGADSVNAIKQANEFGLTGGGQQLAGLLVSVVDVTALGLEVAKGLVFTETFYWDVNEQTRAWARKFGERRDGRIPGMVNAGAYSAALHYLKAVAAAGTDQGLAVVNKMKELPTDDAVFGKGSVRADGRKIHPAYLLEVKRPSESKGAWDLAKVRFTIPANEAFRPLSESECPLLKKD
ncbi:ABC transporter substrate-binding protein [Bradyrhizobium lablabi]|uniref:ABC transporter substrate-binding protein n=1 Tax=Bradyrhizobium lablabi TaxID=722472 RepID=UPI00090A08D4|nr:ABC transporter substrate-binding protein [Bradyrhizobium lablabi]SHM82093.1 amino acid/amide ABC transporter substrate-binding protein, HAAT family [Bradyrhizobium lablabi]